MLMDFTELDCSLEMEKIAPVSPDWIDKLVNTLKLVRGLSFLTLAATRSVSLKLRICRLFLGKGSDSVSALEAIWSLSQLLSSAVVA